MSTCAGASIDAAVKVNHGLSDICVNWSGGLHHAKKGEASGFCYINDIVLGILELLKYHSRVLYIDIDIHHGDGVEEAFYTTDRVMTASFHKYGDFFPGSGALADMGVKDGKYYSVNYPLKDGLDDESFELIFKPVINKIMEVYRPGAVVMCCGADSIAGDRLGVWNLSLKGHGMAVEYMKTFDVPLILLGGGGYTPRNVARCWSYETAIALGQQKELDDTIPFNQYHNYFGPNYKLHLTTDPNLKNQNTRPYLDKCTNIILENLSRLQGAPSVPFQDVPPDFISADREKAARDEADPDIKEDGERRAEHEAEFYDGEKDNDRAKGGEGVDDHDAVPSAGNAADSEIVAKGVKEEPSNDNDTASKMEVDEAAEDKMEVEKKEEQENIATPSDAPLKTAEEDKDKTQRPGEQETTTDANAETKGIDKQNELESKDDTEEAAPESAFEKILPKKRPYPSGTECGGFVPEATSTEADATSEVKSNNMPNESGEEKVFVEKSLGPEKRSDETVESKEGDKGAESELPRT